MDDIKRIPREHQDSDNIAGEGQSSQSHLRPIPCVFPRNPYVVNETFPSINCNERIDHFPQLVAQNDGQLESQPQQVPYFTTIVQPVGMAVASNIQTAQPRIVYAQPPVQGIAFTPYVSQSYCQSASFPTYNPYQQSARPPSQSRDPNVNHRAKPGSVHGIPPEPLRYSTAAPAWDRCCRPFDLLLQPEAVRVFNDYKTGPPSPKDIKPRRKYPKPLESNRTRTSDGSVHIGGILTIPKQSSTYNEESSQNSNTSSLKDDELKPTYLQPGIEIFRKLAQAGFEELKKIIIRYSVKSSKEDLETLCEAVQSELRCLRTGVLQMEPVIREIILSYIRICSSWSSLVSILPTMREQPHPVEDCLSPLVKEFINWQEVSTSMLQRILDALEVLPTEHERCISGLARSAEPRHREPGEDGDKDCSDDSSDFTRTTALGMTIGYSSLPGYVYQSYPGCDIQLTVPRLELSPRLQLDDPLWAHLYPQLDRKIFRVRIMKHKSCLRHT